MPLNLMVRCERPGLPAQDSPIWKARAANHEKPE